MRIEINTKSITPQFRKALEAALKGTEKYKFFER